MGRLNLPRFLLISASLSAATASLWSCGIADWLIGGNIDVNGARGTVSQERGYVGNTMKGYILFGTQNHFRSVDIVALLTGGQRCGQNPNPVTLSEDEVVEQCIEWAFNCFDNYLPGQCPPPSLPPGYVRAEINPGVPQITPTSREGKPLSLTETQRMRRNAVQERLIAASNSACREFTQHLNTYQSYTNFWLGAAAVGTGAAGAIVSGVVAARALSGVTGALAGTRAEFNSDLFAKQLVSTIVQAIDKSREQYLTKLRGSEVEGAVEPSPSPTPRPTQTPTPTPSPRPARGGRTRQRPAKNPAPTATATLASPASTLGKQSLPIEKYSVEAAIADAIYYNDLCSLDKGLQTLTQSLTTAGNPGLDEFYNEIQKYKKIQDTMPKAAAP